MKREKRRGGGLVGGTKCTARGFSKSSKTLIPVKKGGDHKKRYVFLERGEGVGCRQ